MSYGLNVWLRIPIKGHPLRKSCFILVVIVLISMTGVSIKSRKKLWPILTLSKIIRISQNLKTLFLRKNKLISSINAKTTSKGSPKKRKVIIH